MPRGWHENQKPGSSASRRGRPRIPSWRRSCETQMDTLDGEVSPQSQVNSPISSMGQSLLLATQDLNEGVTMTSGSDYQSGSNLQGVDRVPAPLPAGASNTSSEMSSFSNNKPSSLLPAFLGMPSMAASFTGSVPSVSSVPQWMQLLNDEGSASRKQSSKTGDVSIELQLLRAEVKKLKLDQRNWDQERSDLFSEQEQLEEELERERNAKEAAEQLVSTLQRQLRAKEERVQELVTTLSTAQQALDQRGRSEASDWIICRDEIHMSENCLGVGGWGTVVLGKFRGCKVAVKQIHELILSPHNRRLFEREMNIASKCRHPCLLQFIGATNDEGSPLFVTELMETSLRALLEQRALSQTEVFTISLDVAQALNYLHLNRPFPIIHRDVSSANVLLWRQGDQWRGKVSDYGTANFMRQTMTAAPGAPIYCAPEALTSRQTIKIDVYSFGVLLCEMCIRELPDPQRREEQVAMVTDHVLRGLVRHCVQLEPGTRPTMENIIDSLE